MKEILKKYLFEKHLFVNDWEKTEENTFEVLFSLANLFNIRIDSGEKLAQREMIGFAAEMLGENVPEPFYKGFPDSVRKLSPDELLFDQLFHYVITYGFGDFSEAGHSLFEENFDRIAFKENAEIKTFSIITQEEAKGRLSDYVDDLLSGTRPLSNEQYDLVKEFICEYKYQVKKVASKNTCIRLLIDTRNLSLTDFMQLSDVIKLVDELNYAVYGNDNVKKLNLKNQDRKLISSVINRLFKQGRADIRTCYEKKSIWSGLLHHIHYAPKTKEQTEFVYAMRGPFNESVFSEFERNMAEKNIKAAVDALKAGKGSAAVLRNLNYIVSRCETEEDLKYVTDHIETRNVLVLLQLLMMYACYRGDKGNRTFKFVKHNKLRVHEETPLEYQKKRTDLSEKQVTFLADKIMDNLRKTLKNRLGKVYIDPDMVNYALPIQESTSQGGYGSLTRGSRIQLDVEKKKLRAFTYWEKVNDIDLSVFGVDKAGNRMEFSWRTMSRRNSNAITFSGDQTSGYDGGSEYFDIDINAFKSMYPKMRYLILCDNVYSRVTFDKCYCKAGYMIRDIEDSGEVYEPKTVQSAFKIDCNSTFAYLYGFDFETNELIWLNMARDSYAAVAGITEMNFLLDYFAVTDVINVYSFFEMMATELTDDISEAEIIVTDKDTEAEICAKAKEAAEAAG
ncbi:MAG: hypothetical protein K6G22_03535, partial [Lachnospiraceae bacterium]|nr:hypothetical protein [Lachnospiraceae bacterium]